MIRRPPSSTGTDTVLPYTTLGRAARASGVPARIVEAYIKALATKVSIGRDVGANDIFDLIVERERAATGEERLGGLAFAGPERSGKNVELVRWTVDGSDPWTDERGQGTNTPKDGGMPDSANTNQLYGRTHTPTHAT